MPDAGPERRRIPNAGKRTLTGVDMIREHGYSHFVSVYRNHAIDRVVDKFVCGEVKVEIIKESRTLHVREYLPAVLAVNQDAEYRIPSREPLVLPADIPHILLTTRTRRDPSEAQIECEASIDAVITVLSCLLTRDLFRTQLFRGWLQDLPARDLGLVKLVDPIRVDRAVVTQGYNSAFAAMGRTLVQPDRLALMARFVRKGLSEAPSEEAYIWLWTALEVFPMVGTTDITPISEFLASYLQRPPTEVKSRLNIGWLFGMRSKLVHDGHLPLTQKEAFSALSRLELVVIAVLRHAAGLGYDGALDSMLAR